MKINKEALGLVLNCSGSAGSKQITATTPRGITPRQSTGNATPNKATTGGKTARSGPDSVDASPRPTKPVAPSTGPLLISNANDRKDLTYFDLLYTEMGFKSCQKYFQMLTEHTKQRLTENQFITLMRDISDFGDHQIVEVFDIFDNEDLGSVGFQQFFFLVSLFCAMESGQTRKFLYLHPDLIFDTVAINPQSKKIGWEEFCRFGFMMGLSEHDLYLILQDFNIDIFKDISYDDFFIYYYIVTEQVDIGRKSENAWDTPGNVGPDKVEKKDCIIS